MSKSETQVTKMESQSKMMQKYKDLVEQGKKQFQKELESIMPEVKLGQARGMSVLLSFCPWYFIKAFILVLLFNIIELCYKYKLNSCVTLTSSNSFY